MIIGVCINNVVVDACNKIKGVKESVPIVVNRLGRFLRIFLRYEKRKNYKTVLLT